MPRDFEHRFKAQQNEEFAASLNSSLEIQDSWAVVAAFYSALHYVEAYFAKHGQEGGDHKERRNKIKHHPKLNRILSSYTFLFEVCHDARYKCNGLSRDAYVKKAKPQLDTVKTFLNNLLDFEGNVATVPPRSVATGSMPGDPVRPAPGLPQNSQAKPT